MGFLSRFRKPSADDAPPTESWPLFAFGKLPVYKDFISAGLTDDVSREFRDWLSNGFSRHWSSRDDFRSSQIPLHAFLLRLPESRKMAVGALWGSTDQGGLRKFPFALFTILPAGKTAASVLTALDYLPVFESRAREIRRKYEVGGTLAAVYQELRGARIEISVRTEAQVRASLAEALARSRVGPLATALFGNDAATQWTALLAALDGAGRNPSAGAAAFRLPLADEPAPLHQLKLWIVRLTRASPSGTAPSGVLYRIGGAVPCGVVFYRDARAEDILLFHPEAIPTDFVEEIPPAARRTDEPAEAVSEPAVSEPAGTQPGRTEAAPIEPAATEPPAAGLAPLLESAPPAETIPPSEAAPTAGTLPVVEILRLGAAAPAAEVQPAPLPEAPAPPVAAPDAPAVSRDAGVMKPPDVPEPPVVQEPPAVSEPTAVPEPHAAPAPAIPAADALPPASPPVPLPQAKPAGWDLPLASLLETG